LDVRVRYRAGSERYCLVANDNSRWAALADDDPRAKDVMARWGSSRDCLTIRFVSPPRVPPPCLLRISTSNSNFVFLVIDMLLTFRARYLRRGVPSPAPSAPPPRWRSCGGAPRRTRPWSASVRAWRGCACRRRRRDPPPLTVCPCREDNSSSNDKENKQNSRKNNCGREVRGTESVVGTTPPPPPSPPPPPTPPLPPPPPPPVNHGLVLEPPPAEEAEV
jgi:hypothetical protein